MLIKILPRVCTKLLDQANCPKAVAICGADTDPDLCTLKLISLNLTNAESLSKVPHALGNAGWSTVKAIGKFGSKYGHDWWDAMDYWWSTIPS